MYKSNFFYIILSCLLCMIPSLKAQTLSYTSYTTKDGLPSNTITAIFQDSKGYIWIGTNNGLARYDGAEFLLFATSNGLSNNWITWITENPLEPGAIWIGTIAGGVNKWKENKLKSYTFGTDPDSNMVNDMAIDNKGTLWFTTYYGFWKIVGNKIIKVTDSLSPKNPDLIISDKNGNIWCAEKKIIYTYNPITFSWKRINLHLNESSSITSLLSDFDDKHLSGSGSVWIGTSDKLIIELSDSGIVQKQKTLYGIPNKLQDNQHGYLMVRDHDIFFSVSKKNLSDQKLLPLPKNDMLGYVTSPFLFDREGNIWIGTWHKGLLKISDLSLNFFQFPGTAKLNWSNIDNSGNIWLGSAGGVWEIYLDDENHWHQKFHSLQHLGKKTNTFISLIDSENNVWLWSNSKVYVYKIFKKKDGSTSLRSSNLHNLLSFINGGNRGTVLSLFADRQNRLWFSIAQSGVGAADLKTGKLIKFYTVEDGIPGDEVRAIFQDSKNQIWLGGWLSGISIFSNDLSADRQDQIPTLKRKITIDDGLTDNMIRSIFEDSKGNIWIGTRHNGIVIIGDKLPQNWKKISMKDGLLSNSIWEIIEGPDNKMWLNTDVGIEEIDLQTLKVLPPKKEFMLNFDRLLTIRNYRNKYWSFCTNEELFVYESNQRKKTSAPPLIDFTKILVNGNNFSISKLNELSYTQNNITIEFAGLSFKEERAVKYQYRLVGADTNWTSPSGQRQVSFAALSPGEYIFEVRAINSEDIISDLPASLEFTIIPPFWLQWWFIVITISALTILLFLLHRYRINQLLKMESLRVRISSDLHDEIGSSVGSIVLRSRMLQKEENWNTKSKEELGRIQHTANQTYEVLRDIVWFVNPGFDKLDDMILRMKDTAQSLLSGISYEFISPDEVLSIKLSLEFRRNIFLSYKEILHNIAKHSKASEVKIEVLISNGNFSLIIFDNGIGFDFDNNKTSGNGLSSLSKRMESLKGKFEINSVINQGTTIKLSGAKTT